MDNELRRIIIVGGGSAGWLTAGVLAAEHNANSNEGIEITLVESPDVSPIGVGEGTWPTMRATLKKIGISETEFLRECDASFKQGTKFRGWVTGEKEDSYSHPFVLPVGYSEINLVTAWQADKTNVSFSDAVSFQGKICDRGLAPKQKATPEFAHVANYAYHLDAGKLVTFLQKHCVEKLGVTHILDHVVAVNSHDNEDIASIETKTNGDIPGDLFIDCTGSAALLLGKHYLVPFVSKKHILFNDTALAVQVPYATEDSPIASQTISTAQTSGWIWDIALPTRRGIGYVYSSAHIKDEQAEVSLRDYIRPALAKQADEIDIRKLSFKPGHRQIFWHKNCVAVGQSAGFIEPLEASALVMVELSAKMISEQLPVNREVMDIVAKRFNDKFLYRWDRIIDFLKLHYVLSKRVDNSYWSDNCRTESIPENLKMLLKLWSYQPPWHQDFTYVDEVFPSASYQYILYGMGYKTTPRATINQSNYNDLAVTYFKSNNDMINKLLMGLPSNRDLINHIKQYGLQKI